MTDPQQVAEAIWQAIIAKDYDRAREFIIPREKERFTKDEVEGELKGLPPLPESPVVKAVVEGDRGEALLENWEFEQGLEMVKEDGRWWIDR